MNQALGDAGYLERPFARERTCAILGVGGGGMPLSVAYGFRACMPLMDSIPGVPIKSQQIVELGEGILPEWTEDSFPGILLNVAAGRVANRFNLGGPNMAIDAACGSSLAALYAGVRELQDGTSDVAIVMGGDAVQTPYAYVAFSKTHALSPTRTLPAVRRRGRRHRAGGRRRRRGAQAAGRRRTRRRPDLRRHQGRRRLERRTRQGT